MINEISVLGAGSWGTVLSELLAKNGKKIKIWTKNKSIYEEILNQNTNSKYLPKIKLKETIAPTLDIKECFGKNKIIILAIPSKGIRDISIAVKNLHDTSNRYVLASKGIDLKTFDTMSEILSKEANIDSKKIFVLSGPNLANEVFENFSSASVLAGENSDEANKISKFFNNDTFKIFLSSDKKGVELAGALKNIYAISAGLSDGLGSKSNTKAMLLTRSLSEMTELFLRLNANPSTLLGLAGVGDLFATSSSTKSRNYSFGWYLGQNISPKEALKKVGQVVEGVNTLETVFKKKNELDLSMPIVDVLYKIIFSKMHPKDCFANIFLESNNIDIKF